MQDAKKKLNVTFEDLDYYHNKTIKNLVDTSYGATPRMFIKLPTESTKTTNDNLWIDTTDSTIRYKIGSNEYKLEGTLVTS